MTKSKCCRFVRASLAVLLFFFGWVPCKQCLADGLAYFETVVMKIGAFQPPIISNLPFFKYLPCPTAKRVAVYVILAGIKAAEQKQQEIVAKQQQSQPPPVPIVLVQATAGQTL